MELTFIIARMHVIDTSISGPTVINGANLFKKIITVCIRFTVIFQIIANLLLLLRQIDIHDDMSHCPIYKVFYRNRKLKF